jgi:uncharacterized protein YdeI (YjbR/CyaY-like superfamily)
MTATFFKTSTAFRAWMSKNHAKIPELLVGFHKVDSGRGSITYQEALDEALAFGWIDGVRRRIDEFSYSIRFTPRRARSIWSNVNVKRVGELIAAGRMAPPGLAVFERRDAKRSGIYSYESTSPPPADAFGELELAAFKANKKAWAFFEAQAPYYKKLMVRRTMSAKREETRARRLAQLIEYSRRGERIPLIGSIEDPPVKAKRR